MFHTQNFGGTGTMSTARGGFRTGLSSRPKTAQSVGRLRKKSKQEHNWEYKWENMLDKVSQENSTKHKTKRQYFDN